MNKHPNLVTYTDKKVVISGHVIEVYYYEVATWKPEIGIKRKPKEAKEAPTFIQDMVEEQRTRGQPDEHTAKYNRLKTLTMFRRLVSANFTNRDKFLTLTFEDTDEFDITDVEQTNKEFKKFIQRMKYRYGDFKYIAVIEYQDKFDRGAVHYHMIVDIKEKLKMNEFREIWGMGFVKANRIKKVDNIGAYMSKYMSKNFRDERLKGKKNYLTSQHRKGNHVMIRPVELRGSEADEVIEKIIKENITCVYSKTYQSEYNGNTHYLEYNEQRQLKGEKPHKRGKETGEAHGKRSDPKNPKGGNFSER